MRSWQTSLVAAIAFCAATASYTLPAQAGGKWRVEWASDNGAGGSNHSSHPGQGGGGGSWSSGSSGSGGAPGGSSSAGGASSAGGGSRGAPGPIAGAGLPFLLLAGGYALMRRHRSKVV